MTLLLTFLFACSVSTTDSKSTASVCTADQCACASNESCDLDCSGQNNCAADCGAESTCDVDCADANNCAVQCSSAAECTVDCGSSSSCAVTCPTEGCTVTNCELSSGCIVTCAGGAAPTRDGSTTTCP